MNSSKEVCINLEDLLMGAFSILLATNKELELTYDQLFEYESQVVNYFQERNYEIIVYNDQEEQNRMNEQYPELRFEEDKIVLTPGIDFLEVLKSQFISDDKSQALMSDETINVLMPRQYMKKNNSI